ncbi:MAG: ATP-grasp domain-containing protein, partial [Planctomycetota bacterium]
GLDAFTYEFESIPVGVVRALGDRMTMRPGSASLRVCQDRLLEKRAFGAAGLDIHPWRPVETDKQLVEGVSEVGVPCVLKRRFGGYDGKGQRVIRNEGDALDAWGELGREPCIVEAFVAFERELSVVGARSASGEVAFWPVTQNRHERGILVESVAPAPGVDAAVSERAHGRVEALVGTLGHVGVFAVEFFDCGGVWYANESAPRVHNTGHWTIEGSHTSQFEQHLRAVLGLELGSTLALGHCGMVNLIGAVPPVEALARLRGVRTHAYAKGHKPGRKVGHLTTVMPTAADRDDALEGMREAAGQGGTVGS